MDSLLLRAALAMAANMALFYLLSLWRRDISLVDIAWPIGFMLAALLPALAGRPYRGSQLPLALLVWLWGLRLGAHIAVRRRGRGEDPRYAAMRRRWGRQTAWRSLLSVFALQGVLQWLVALPVLLALADPAPRTSAFSAALLLGLAGIALETAADLQRLRFRRQPGNRERLLDSGLWRYSRHPNYFGESLVWWGLATAALPAPHGALGLVSPLLLTALLLFVSGIPPLEKPLAGRPDFEAYKRRTPAFVPWFPKNDDPPSAAARP